MKRIDKLASIVLISMLTITGCGINKEITYKENVLEDELKKISITQSSLDINVDGSELFIPLYYKDNDILGLLSKKEGAMIVSGYPASTEAKDKMYKVNSDNSVSETEDNVIANSIDCAGKKSQRGIYTDDKKNKIYFYDRIEGRKTEIEINSKPEYNEELQEIKMYGDNIKGSEDYFLITQVVLDKEKRENLGIADFEEVMIVLKNIKTSEEYVINANEKTAEMADIIYDRITEKFYLLTYSGEILELVFNKEEIDLKEYGQIDLIAPIHLNRNSIYIDDKGEIVMGIYNSTKIITTYNFKTKETKDIENPLKGNAYVENYLVKNNLFIINKPATASSMQAEYYIGGLKGDTIEIYDKINYEMGDFNMVEMAPTLINDDGTELIITLAFSNSKDAYMPEFSHYEYKKINIKRG